MYYKVKFLQEAKYTKEDLQKMIGTKVPVYDSEKNQRVSEYEFTQEDCEWYMEVLESETFTQLFKVESTKELDDKINRYLDIHDKTRCNYHVLEKRKVDWEELVEDELQYLYQQIFMRYLKMKLKPEKMDSEKYQELKSKYLGEKKYTYEMLCYINKMFEAEEQMGRDNPHYTKSLKEMSAKHFIDQVKFLSDAEDLNEMFMMI